MVLYNCSFCQYSTSNKNNYTKHLNTKKHLLIVSQKKQQNDENEEKNEENEEKVASNNTNYILNEISCPQNDPQNICQFCSKKFSRNDNLKRHISVCKLNFSHKKVLKDPKGSKNEEKSCQNDKFICYYCSNNYQTKRGLNKHVRKCWMRIKIEQDQKDENKLLHL